MTTRWGILAPGRIAHTLANAMSQTATAELVAVGSRAQRRADEFANQYGDIAAYGSYEDLLEDSTVEAIYIATPHPQHAEWTIKALQASKAVLCEKPMGLNHAEVMAMVHTAKLHDQLLMEAFMYRMHPQTHKLQELVEGGTIGELRHIHATFGFHAPFSSESRLYAAELGGGGIMDVGCYPVSMARLIAGSEPTEVTATGKIAQTGADIYTAALLSFDGGIGAHIATGVGQQLDNSVAIFGSHGSLHVETPWRCPENWKVRLNRGSEQEAISGTTGNPYVHQLIEFDRCLQAGLVESPLMDWNDSLGNANVLDKWRNQVGVTYPQEKANSLAPAVRLGSRAIPNVEIPTERIKGLNKDLSRVVMGCDNQPDLSHAKIMFDHFAECGGNVFDTAYIYGGGRIERLLGQWLKARQNRDDLVIIGKGAHTPLNRPEYCKPQLTETLDRLQTDYLDIYFLHRDNIDVPVGEWIDALNELRDQGLIRVFGGSNWELPRVREANDYAKATDKHGYTVISNQFSLAKMLSPVWPGCVSANSRDFRDYMGEHEVALFPWSSQARGFFTERFDQIQTGGRSKSTSVLNQPADEEMKRCWLSDENIERRQRADSLAKKLGVDLINVALAYVLAQPFATFPLIGPRYSWELSNSLQSLKIELTELDLDELELS